MASRAQKTLFLSAGGLAALALLFSVLKTGGEDVPAAVVAKSASASGAPEASSAPAPVFARTGALDKFVGSVACAECHETQADAYATSHHADALVRPTPDKLKTKLAGASFSSKLGGVTRFAERDGELRVTTPNTGGSSATFPVAYAAGVWPLQQYVVATERGKLQSLGVVWDSRSKGEGGERWFHVYGREGIAHDDSLFFTNAAQNWNHVCADCHSTFVERRYTVADDRFDTRWAELSVGCEACHGPGTEHVRQAKAGTKGAWDSAKGLVVGLKVATPWAPAASGSPTPRPPDAVEIEVCAPCHSRREPLDEGFLAGDLLLDAFEPELLHAGRYHADGQVEGEVYEWGSFLQSRMYASGVRCSDCHEPHSAKLYATGDALCVRCHAPARFATESHSHHTGDKSPACIDCHMPPAVFMQVDERRDHSIRIPRPDHSVEFGTPNACNGCHTKQSASWALENVRKWFPGSAKRPHFVEAFARERKGALDAPRALNALARESSAPAIARATALELLGRFPTEKTLSTLRTALSSPEPLVVYGGVRGAAGLPLAQRAELLVPLVTHRVRAVRIAAGKALAPVPLAEVDTQARAALERVFAEVESSFDVGASRPEVHVERSAFELARGRREEAERELRTALRFAPCLAAAHLNFADLARDRHDEVLAEKEIRAALKCEPQNAYAHHALGLWQVRTRDPHAVASLRKAVELAPTETRFGYVLAVAIAESGDIEAALLVIEAALEKRPNDVELLQASIAYRSRTGRLAAAGRAQKALDSLVRD